MARGGKILVVEDDDIMAELIQIMLMEHGYEVTLVGDGSTAWTALKGDSDLDLVLLDRGLPDMDGLTLLRRIKAEEKLRHLPVVLQTGRDDVESASEGVAAGAFYYLTKPLQPAMVVAVIQAALAQQRDVAAMRTSLTDVGQTLKMMESGTFRFHTLAEAQTLALGLSRACPDPTRSLLGLQELMINAIEHGNYGITYAQKTSLLTDNRWHEELERLQADPVCSQRWATVHLSRTPTQLVMTIQDQGDGFDWHEYLDFSPERALDLHGRGIAMARLTSFDALDYQGNGNTVVVKVDLPVVTAHPATTQPASDA